jgi:uncharacterized protein (TIGR00251 family)
MPSFIQQRPEGLVLAVKVQPRSTKNEIGGAMGNELKIKVTAPPVDSAANEALIDFLADTLDCPRSAISLLRGQTSRHKQLLIVGLLADEVARRLGTNG